VLRGMPATLAPLLHVLGHHAPGVLTRRLRGDGLICWAVEQMHGSSVYCALACHSSLLKKHTLFCCWERVASSMLTVS
jgi:hypothetical protein